MDFFKAVVVFLRAFLVSRASLAAENVALRQQLNVLQRTVKRPKLRWRDRLFWVWLSRLWAGWRTCLMLVKPETVIHWHRRGFKQYWCWKSKAGKVGRPKTDAEIRDLIRRMSSENVALGAPRIQSELRLLGYTVAKATVANYMVKHPKPPSQNGRTFLDNHVRDIVAIDFFTVPTLTFGLLYGFLVLRHDRREVIHFNVTAHPTALWTAQQIVEAFPWDEAPRYLLRDRDAIFSAYVQQRIQHLGIEEVVTAPRSPWQNPYAERVIGSLRRECLDHLIVLNERHLKRILSRYLAYYHTCRPHLSLQRNAPQPRPIQPPDQGQVIALPQVGGLHQCYQRAA